MEFKYKKEIALIGRDNVTLVIRHFSQDDTCLNISNYINVSDDNTTADVAAVTLVVRDRPDESDLLSRGRPGSIPGRSAPAS